MRSARRASDLKRREAKELRLFDELSQVAIEASDASKPQWSRFLMLRQSLKNLVSRRDLISRVFIEAPWGADHSEIQATAIDRIEAFYQGYYATLSHAVALVKTYPEVFGSGWPHNSMSAFLKRWEARFPNFEPVVATLEQARVHRTFLDHAPSIPSYGLFTYDNARFEMTVAFFGDGKVPEGAIAGYSLVVADWEKKTPDYNQVLNCLSILVSAMCVKIINHFAPDFPLPDFDAPFQTRETPELDDHGWIDGNYR